MKNNWKKLYTPILIVALLAVFSSFPTKTYAAFSYYKSLTLDHTQAGTSDSTDWPLTIALESLGTIHSDDADLKDVGPSGFVQSSNGYDIRPYSDSACSSALTYQLVYYDGANGKLEMHVKIPTLSHTSDTVIYLCFGDASLTSDGSSTATWDSGFKTIYHWIGPSLNLNDATSNGLNATTPGLPFTDVGQILGGIRFNGGYTVTANGMDTINNDNTHTVSFWAKANATMTNNPVLWSSRLDDNGANIDYFFEINDNAAYWGYRSITHPTGNRVYNIPSLGTTWHYFSFGKTAVGDNGDLYIDGVHYDQSSGQLNDLINETGYGMYLGTYGHQGGLEFNGIMDEFRQSNVVRDSSWVTADYNSQKPSSTFITWGSKTAVGGGGGGVTNLPVKVHGRIKVRGKVVFR